MSDEEAVAEVLSQGQATREVVQALQFDVRVLGNHDFAWIAEELLAEKGEERLVQEVRESCTCWRVLCGKHCRVVMLQPMVSDVREYPIDFA